MNLRHPARRLPDLCLILCLILNLLPGPLFAHAGEDHGDAPAPVTLAHDRPRLDILSDVVELVAVQDGDSLQIYLDDADHNNPVPGAKLEISAGQHKANATEIKPGQYQATTPWLNQPGQHSLIFSIEAADLFDLLEGTLDTRTHPDNTPPQGWRARLQHWLADTPAPAITQSAAHADDRPRRLPDGRLFVPKPSQRLLGIRTERAQVASHARSLSLNGRIMADPGASGVVQAGQDGRLEPGPGGLPRLGQPVKAGDVLALLAPLGNSLERGNQQATLADLDNQLALASKRAQRLQTLTGSLPQKDIDAAQQEVISLRQRRAALNDSLHRKQPLRAPVDGVIGTVDAVAGQVVSVGTLLFSIIQPDKLWVEALSWDPALPLPSQGAHLYSGQQHAALEFVGAAATLRDQALPLQFRILPPVPPLAIGQAVTVLAPTTEIRQGIALPTASLSRSSDGLPALWIHETAEIFRPLPVVSQTLDGQRILVTSEVPTHARIVTTGASGLGQIR